MTLGAGRAKFYKKNANWLPWRSLGHCVNCCDHFKKPNHYLRRENGRITAKFYCQKRWYESSVVSTWCHSDVGGQLGLTLNSPDFRVSSTHCPTLCWWPKFKGTRGRDLLVRCIRGQNKTLMQTEGWILIVFSLGLVFNAVDFSFMRP